MSELVPCVVWAATAGVASGWSPAVPPRSGGGVAPPLVGIPNVDELKTAAGALVRDAAGSGGAVGVIGVSAGIGAERPEEASAGGGVGAAGEAGPAGVAEGIAGLAGPPVAKGSEGAAGAGAADVASAGGVAGVEGEEPPAVVPITRSYVSRSLGSRLAIDFGSIKISSF